MANYKFIVNPTAARGKCARVASQLDILCRENDLDYSMDYTTRPQEATDMARKASDQFSHIIAVGGDGTVHETVNGLIGTKTVFGVIAVGSGNDFVRALELPLKLQPALQTIIGGHIKKIDIGKANDRYFPNGLGVGFDSWVVEEGHKIKRLRGNAIYLYAVLKTIYKYEAPVMNIRYNDINRSEKIFMVTAGNGVSLGGGFKLTPDAVMDDGLLDLNIIKDLSKFEIYQNLLSVYSGSHTKMEQVTTGRTDKMIIESEEGFAVHLDGELMSLNMNLLEVSILPKALNVIIPDADQA